MLTTAYYFLQVLLCSALMMGYYWLVLRNKRFHQYNRFYLLMVAIVSWLVPLIKIKWGHTEAIQFLNVVADSNSQMDVIVADRGFRFNWNSLAISVYFLVAGVLLIGMLNAFYRLYHLLKTHSCKSVGEVYLVLTHAKGTPFSFFRYIFWNEEIDIRSDSGKQILQHELTHVQEKHSFDKVLIQVVLIAGWFNPFFWMIKKELEMIHEFIADRKAVKDGDTAALAQMLLASIYPQQQFALTNPFFFSPIKRRLKMLANQQNPKFSYVRRLVVLPLLAIVIVLFAFRNKDQQTATTLSVQSVLEHVVTQGKELLNNTLLDTTKNNKPDSVIIKIDGKATKFPNISFREDSVAKPLILVDFKKMTKEEMEKIDTKDIATVYVLKNGSSKVVYGEEGKNGVVLITTKAYAEAHKASPTKSNSMPQALFILDGVKTDSTILETMDPNQIQSIDIKKGEMAKAMYGDEGANGVIMITSKPKVNTSLKSTTKVSVSEIDMGNATVIGYNENNDPAKKEFLERNPSVKNVYWWAYKSLKMQVELKDGSEEVYDLSKPESKQKAEAKYGKLPSAPPPPPPPAPYAKNNAIEGIEVSDLKLEKTNNQQNKTYISRFPSKVEVNPHVNVNSSTNVDTHTTLVGVKADSKSDLQTIVTVNDDTEKQDKVFTATQTPAEFPGGEPAWQKYLMRNLNLEMIAKNGGPPGKYTVVVSFIVDKSGNVSDVKAENDPGYGTKDEAIRIIVKGPMWKPAMQNGKTVVYRHNTSITWVVSEPGGKSSIQTTIAKPDSNKDLPKVFIVSQEPATFPGGEEAWQKYLHTQISSMDIVVKKGGPPGTYKVVVSFIVDKEGNLSDIKAENDPGYGTKEEAIKLIAKGPKWIPAKQNGKLVVYRAQKTITWTVTDESKMPAAKTKPVIRDTVKAGTKKISVPQVLAEFPGGEVAWQKYLQRNKNLDMVVKNGAGPGTYKVYVHFVVGADGSVSDVGTTNDPGYGTKAEAIRLLAKGPKWKPGLLNGQPVTTMNLKPITWTVSEE